jgi:predicted outer membrane lipoprotein
MENPIDHTIDLGFVNYTAHPENKKYVVFRFSDASRAASFENELILNAIWFEKSDDDKRGKRYDLYAIHTTDFKKTEKINYKVEAMHKKYIISSKPIRNGLFIFSLFVMTLTIIGYIKSTNKLSESIPNVVRSNK